MSITIEQLTAAYEEEKKNARPPVTAADIPLNYDAITPEWLTAVLCDKHPGAKVLSHRLDARSDGTSNRIRIFIEYNEAGKQAALPERVFCKSTYKLAQRIALGLNGAHKNEAYFYNKLRPLLSIEAPICCYANYNKSANSIIIMPELDPETIFCTYSNSEISRARVENQLRVLASFHGRFLESAELKTSLAIFSTWSETFSNLDYADFENACDKGFEMAEEVIPARLFRRRAEIWSATRKSWERHHHLPHTLMHGDPHLGNWYITPGGAMGLYDWQTVSRGHWSRDVIYALTTSLTIEHRREWLPDLLCYYHDQLQQTTGRTIPFDGTLDECRRQLFTALAFWTITLNTAPGMPQVLQPRDITLEALHRISTAIDDLDALDSFD
jgi:Phosphotransferase enzyme family